MKTESPKIDVYIIWIDFSVTKWDRNVIFVVYDSEGAGKEHHVRGVTVWCGLSFTVLIGPYCIGQICQQMLKIMISCLNDLFKNENEVYFQLDGAPRHFHVNVRNNPDYTFNQIWIQRIGSAIEFSPRFPDLAPLDYRHLFL